MFVAGGCVLHLPFQPSSALALRLPEYLGAFSVFIIASAWLEWRAVPVPMALSCSAPGVMRPYGSELFTRDEVAPGSSHVQ